MVEIKSGASGSHGITIEVKRTPTDYRNVVYVSGDTTNCKLGYIHGAGNLSHFNENELKQAFDGILKSAKGCVILNTTSRIIFDFISKTYPVYYKHEVPIGYSGMFQYHICFKNVIINNANCRMPEEPLLYKPVIDKEYILRKLQTILKLKRRKNDYAEEFVNSL